MSGAPAAFGLRRPISSPIQGDYSACDRRPHAANTPFKPGSVPSSVRQPTLSAIICSVGFIVVSRISEGSGAIG
jgi:hypothetical protein